MPSSKTLRAPPIEEAPPWYERRRRWLLAGSLLTSLGLRWWLAASGGEGFWPDETRYGGTTRHAVGQFAAGLMREGWSELLANADHVFFKIAGIPVAWWGLNYGQHPAVVAAYFGVFSVLSLWLIYGIARRSGAGAREALLATFFAAGANSLFYYTRHFLPYDLSLFFCLLSLWLALGKPVWWRSFAAGFAAAFGFLSYNGYWLLAGAALVWHVLAGRTVVRLLLRAVWAGFGLLVPILLVVLAAHLLGHDLIASF